MKKSELIAKLNEFEEDLEVVFDSASSLDNEWPKLNDIGSVNLSERTIGIFTSQPQTYPIIVLEMW